MNRLVTSKAFVIVAVSTLLLACGDAFSPDGVSGTYNLVSVNGADLPATLDGFVFTAGSITLTADGTWTVSITVDGDVETSTGTFTLVEPSTIRFAISGDAIFSATLDGSRLTLAEDGDTFVFRR